LRGLEGLFAARLLGYTLITPNSLALDFLASVIAGAITGALGYVYWAVTVVSLPGFHLGRGGEMRLYLRKLKRLFLPAFIGTLIVAIPVCVLAFTVLPHYIGYTEPKPYTDSLLSAFISALLTAFFSPLIEKEMERKKK